MKTISANLIKVVPVLFVALGTAAAIRAADAAAQQNPAAKENLERSQKEHLIVGRKIEMFNMRGYRFAEVALFTGTSPQNAVADFYNSTGVDDPTPRRFAALDKDKIKAETKSMNVFLNPPRYWMFDEFRVFEVGDDREFGGIKMTWMGVVDVATLQKAIIGGNYSPGYIHRDNSYTYKTGSEVYLLDAPGGEVFVMQSYNAHTDEGLKAEKNPATLGSRLKLPAGWKFRAKVLDRDLVVSQEKTGTLAHVMQDDLLNRYQGSDGGKAFNYVP
jgi:hypothetical protein